MEIIKKEMKENKIALKAENMDDLWHLKNIIEEGDKVTAKTVRKTTVKRGSEIDEGKKEAMVLTIRAEKISLENLLRVTGKIVEGPEKVSMSHHTLSIEPGTILTIEKDWKKYHLERLEKAKIKKPLLLVCVLDRDDADFAMVKESGIDWLASIHPVSSEDESRPMYYQEVMEFIESHVSIKKGAVSDVKNVIIAGPGFERENISEYIRSHNIELSKHIILEHASATGRPGLQEVLKKSANKVLTDTRVARESAFVEEVLKRINTGGLVAYGKK